MSVRSVKERELDLVEVVLRRLDVKPDFYDVTSDGQRFLILTGEQYRPTSATILLNWFERPAND